ncbi:MAG: ribonuclease P protein component [Rikenellaceae bacterium]
MTSDTPHTSSNSLPREERLRGRGAVSTLFAEGTSGFSFPIRYVWREGSGDVDSVLFTVPKRFHKRANRRNLLRRRVKEAYRLQKSLLPKGDRGLDIALIYSSKEQFDYDKISKSVARILTLIGRESGRIVEE